MWARGEVTDTNRYVETVAPLAQDPAIQEAVTNRITDEIFKYVDVAALTSEAVATISANRDLTPQQTAALQALTGPLNSGIQSYTEDAVNKVVQSQQFEAAWVEANTLVHQRLNEALTGQNTDNALMVQDNQVVLDLGNLITQVKQLLISKGFTVAEKIPTTETTIVLFDAPNASAVQTGYNLLNTLGFWLPLIAITLAVVGVFVCHTPQKALAWFGFGLMLAMAVGAGLLAFGRMTTLNGLPDTVNDAAATAFFDQFTSFLKQGLWAGAAAGLVLFLGGLLMGDGQGGDRHPLRAGEGGCGDPGLARVAGPADDRRTHLGGLAGDRAADRSGTRRAGVHHAAALQDARLDPVDDCRSAGGVVRHPDPGLRCGRG